MLATLAAERTGASQSPEALLSGYHLAFLIGALALAVATVIAALVLRSAPKAQKDWSPAEYSASVT